ncbi:MAG: DUF192 domain-containing protein [Actinomycetota bacterium]|nr:DUF192 domain-containing protein [Actinomycetota bacterium]
MTGAPSQGWLVHDGRVLASAEVATSRSGRRRGLLGRDGVDGVLVIPTRSVHTFGMRFAIDVAFCGEDGTVRRTVTLRPNRVTMPVRGAVTAIEAPAGSFASWGLVPGDVLEVR